MELNKNENILFKSENDEFLITDKRIRLEDKSIWGSSIKSTLLKDVDSIELRTNVSFSLLLKSILIPVLINTIVFLINNVMNNSKLLIYFFGKVSINNTLVIGIFYLTILIFIAYLISFFLSINKQLCFHTGLNTIALEKRMFNLKKATEIIDLVEGQKMKNDE